MNYELFILLLLVGSVVGVTAGLLGIGGGLIIVPTLTVLLPQAGVQADVVMQVSLATSLATIILTSGSSALNHLKLGNIDIYVIKWLLPGVIIGGVAGSFIAEFIPSHYLPKIFGVIVLCLVFQMLFSIKSTKQRPLPNAPKTVIAGSIIGTISSLAGIGGGSLMVPFLNRYGIEMRRAVGSASVCSCVIALSGMVGFIVHGIGVDHLPKYSIGYVYLPALVAIVSTSIFTTRLGANLASRLPTVILKKIFAVFLLFVAVKMLLSS